MRKCLIVLSLLALLLGACEKGEKVGSEELIKSVDEKKAQQALGNFLKSPEPTQQGKGALGASPTAGAEKKDRKKVEFALIDAHPFFVPSPPLEVEAGSMLRIVNRDDNDRQFRTSDGTYDSGVLPPGGSAEFPVDAKGNFEVSDPKVPFITGIPFEVY